MRQFWRHRTEGSLRACAVLDCDGQYALVVSNHDDETLDNVWLGPPKGNMPTAAVSGYRTSPTAPTTSSLWIGELLPGHPATILLAADRDLLRGRLQVPTICVRDASRWEETVRCSIQLPVHPMF